MRRPDAFDLPEPNRCHCGAVEPFRRSDFLICSRCEAVMCPTCGVSDGDGGKHCQRCQDFLEDMDGGVLHEEGWA